MIMRLASAVEIEVIGCITEKLVAESVYRRELFI